MKGQNPDVDKFQLQLGGFLSAATGQRCWTLSDWIRFWASLKADPLILIAIQDQTSRQKIQIYKAK